MEKFYETWEWTKKIAGVFVTVCLCLYVIRCVSSGQVLTLEQYERWFNALAKTIFG